MQGKDQADVDQLDVLILEQLQQDSNRNYRAIAKACSTTAGTVHNRIHRMRELGILQRFTVSIDPAGLGYDLCVIMDLQVAGGQLERVQQRYAKDPNVCAMYDVSGEYNTTFIAKFRTMAELNRFVKNAASEKFVVRSQTKIVLKVHKEDALPALRTPRREEQLRI